MGADSFGEGRRVGRRFPPALVIFVLCVGSLGGALMQTLVIPLQSELPRLLDSEAENTAWAVTATLLAAAVAMPVAGRLADMFGKKRVLVVAAVILAIGSVIAASSHTLAPFLVGRTLQGCSMGYMPVAISVIREVTPPERRAGAIAAVSATLGVGGAFGLPLAAWIAENHSWHGVFWFSTAFAVLVVGLTLLVVPSVRDGHPAPVDVVGILGLAAGMCSWLIGVSKGSMWGWTDPRTVGTICAGIAILLLWGWYEWHRSDPLVDLRTTSRRPVLLTNVAAVLIGFGMMGQSVVVPQLLELPAATGFGLGQSVFSAGVWMAPAGLTMILFAPVSSALIRNVGARVSLATGGGVIAAGYLVALFFMGSPWQVMIGVVVSSAGVGLSYAAMPAMILDNVPEGEAASAVGINGLMRSIGATVAGAVMAAVLTSRTDPIAGHEFPIEVMFRVAFATGAVAALAGAMAALFIPRRRRTSNALIPAEG